MLDQSADIWMADLFGIEEHIMGRHIERHIVRIVSQGYRTTSFGCEMDYINVEDAMHCGQGIEMWEGT